MSYHRTPAGAPLAALDPIAKHFDLPLSAQAVGQSLGWQWNRNGARVALAATLGLCGCQGAGLDALGPLQAAAKPAKGLHDKVLRELFVRQDKFQAHRDGLIKELERQVQQRVMTTPLLAVEWEMS